MLYLDTNIFIFLLEGKPDESQRIKLLFDTLKARPNAAVTSELTLAEVLAGPGIGRIASRNGAIST